MSNASRANRSVFYDQSRRRWRIVKTTASLMGLFLILVVSVFVVSIYRSTITPLNLHADKARRQADAPQLPKLTARAKEMQRYVLSKVRRDFLEKTRQEKLAAAAVRAQDGAPEPVVAAFYTIWQESGLHSLKSHGDKLTHFMPEWLHISSDGARLDYTDWNPSVVYYNRQAERIARQKNLKITPVLNNAEESVFDPARVHALLVSPALRRQLAQELKKWLKSNNYAGVNIDFETLYPDDYALVPGFLQELRSILGNDLIISLDIEAANNKMDWAAAAKPCDFVVVMGYDENYAVSKPGPLASLDWYGGILQKAKASIPQDKLVIGIGNYAYDWTYGEERAATLTFQKSLMRAHDYISEDHPEKAIDFDPVKLNPTFNYTDENRRRHEVWMLDAVTAANQWFMAKNAGVRGSALWLLGSEDPSIWSFIDKNSPEAVGEKTRLEDISFSYGVEFDGDGDILRVKATPSRGARKLEADPQTGMFIDESYLQYPSAFIIGRSGYVPGSVALTFDDGPYEPYTSQILDVLQRESVPSTFFVIGENIEKHPDIIRRMWDEGHEIGNHSFTHPDMGAVTPTRARLELNGTERALRSVLNRSTLIFRAPYNADAEPRTEEEVFAVNNAARLGYITVGEYIDPRDWALYTRYADSHVGRRTPAEVAEEVIAKVHDARGSTVLFHDGGGNRKLTVEAIKIIIPRLKKEGYKFVRVSRLLNTKREIIMPMVKSDGMFIGTDRLVFELTYLCEELLSFLFIAGIVLGVLRILFVITFAFIARGKESARPELREFEGKVSVIIPAYNERTVVCHTIGSILAGDRMPAEIILADDGSTDGTAEVVRGMYGNNPLIKIISRENCGKAAALNYAIAHSSGDVLICLDADTLFAPDTVSRLASHFADPRVGAVAGNIKVGNRINLVTRWQAIEYITSQNLDRRAYAFLNAVTVVPGSVGAWRRSALIEAGGYTGDTLAEDMDLTWRLRRAGYIVNNEPDAFGFTETPDTLRTLFRQRFRWTFGTLQCLWKHRDMVGGYGWFGRFMLPSIWLFQICFQVISPIIDLQLILASVKVGNAMLASSSFTRDWQPIVADLDHLYFIVVLYLLFFIIELGGSAIAFWMEKEDYRLLWRLLPQRFAYRQIMYAVVFRSLLTAVRGMYAGWGKIERKGTVKAAIAG